MSSNIFINYSLGGMNLSYKLLGKTMTNWLIDKTAGGLFTSGPTINTLLKDISSLEKRKVGGVGNYVVEGLETMND